MDIGSLGGGSFTLRLITDMIRMQQTETVESAGVSVMRQVLDVQKTVAEDLFRSLDIGGNIDTKA